jgi:gamma-glutamylcyclotransferase (GGCT)/AIG2-like uncharacterized protein YtfP
MQQQSTLYLFVYGSLRSGFSSVAYNYISKYFTLVGLAKTKGVLYDMGEYPVAQPTVEDKFIVGELYKINNPEAFDFVFAQIDDYEGTSELENMHYVRTRTSVLFEDKNIDAWVYWYNGNVDQQQIIPSGDVFDFFKIKNKKI